MLCKISVFIERVHDGEMIMIGVVVVVVVSFLGAAIL